MPRRLDVVQGVVFISIVGLAFALMEVSGHPRDIHRFQVFGNLEEKASYPSGILLPTKGCRIGTITIV